MGLKSDIDASGPLGMIVTMGANKPLLPVSLLAQETGDVIAFISAVTALCRTVLLSQLYTWDEVTDAKHAMAGTRLRRWASPLDQ